MGANLTNSTRPLQEAIHNMAAYLTQHGYAKADSIRAATLFYYNQLENQTRLLAFMDCFRLIGWITLLAVPLLFFIHHFKVGGKPSANH